MIYCLIVLVALFFIYIFVVFIERKKRKEIDMFMARQIVRQYELHKRNL